MKKEKKKKTVSLLLAAAMIITSFPVSGKEAKAAGTSDCSLSVTAFATKNQLMSAFTPDENGSSSATPKLAFGKNSTSAVQEWYILGKDNGVTGDNTVLFAAGPIATDQKYKRNMSGTQSYDDTWGCVYTTIKAGTNDQIVLAMSTYWSSGSDFWLRTPYPADSSNARVAVPGSRVNFDLIREVYALVPAFNLNLSSVIFASAAKAASSGNAETGMIADGTAMTLRLDGSDKTIGTVMYDDAAGKIAAQKDAGAAGTVSLVVQGNDGTKDWYYSMAAKGATGVTKEQIQTACGISGDISLADCKIWLETTIDNVSYAKKAEAVVTITDSMITLVSGPHY